MSNRETIQIDTQEDRYARLGLIPWWDQQILHNAKVMVVGAGALGNEIIKNLALLGVGNILIVDFDIIETSNLSRSVLYRTKNNNQPKAYTAAKVAGEINPDCIIKELNADITSEVGFGLFRWANVVVCGLDNREARLAVNKACWKVNRPWVDGATESFQGVARVFMPPDGVCFECTLSEQDQKLMNLRNSCGFLAKLAHTSGGTPTTPTTAAVIAGIEVQEAIKLLHKDIQLPNLVGKGFFFDGNTYDCFTIEYVRKDDCLSHETYDNIIETKLTRNTATLADVLAEAEKILGNNVVIDLPSEMITELRCSECGNKHQIIHLLHSIDQSLTICNQCNRQMVPEVEFECTANSPYASIPLVDLGFGIMDIISAHCGDTEVHIEISGDIEELEARQ